MINGGALKNLKNLAFPVFDAFKARDQKKLRKLNDVVLKDAGLHLSKSLYELAVLSYVLSKIVSKPRFFSKSNAPHLKRIENSIRDLIRLMDQQDDKLLLDAFKKIEEGVNSLERIDARFVRNIVSKGKLKTAATMYAQGISLGLAAEVAGIPRQDIMDYAGKTMMFDRVKEEMHVKDRLKAARRALGEHK
jgi:hypothetical protein